jgi:hypothetical protein
MSSSAEPLQLARLLITVMHRYYVDRYTESTYTISPPANVPFAERGRTTPCFEAAVPTSSPLADHVH